MSTSVPLYHTPQRRGPTASGNRSIHDEELKRKLFNFLKAGISLSNACGLIRLPEATVHEWRRKGLADIDAGQDTVYSEFFYDFAAAKAVAPAKAERVLQRLIERGDVRAVMWYLSRRMPHQYGDRVQVEVEPMRPTAISRTVEQETADRHLAVARILRDAGVLDKLGTGNGNGNGSARHE